MKRSDFINKVLKSRNNTVFVTPEQVENAIEVFEKLGMLPPTIKEFVEIPPHNILGAGFKVGHNVNKWEDEDEKTNS